MSGEASGGQRTVGILTSRWGSQREGKKKGRSSIDSGKLIEQIWSFSLGRVVEIKCQDILSGALFIRKQKQLHFFTQSEVSFDF